ncbi:KGGVGR-motif variant AAA ATPase [Aquimonas sp.]|jgi:cellulose biosynthesis protein BcsQ|uniref:KGGVGR-motif variant AAA ATPase n=1 Tax=Aquimonas sp. TaxID=1872588 RepID=UPI0037C11190
MSTTIFFDDSLPRMVRLLTEHGGRELTNKCVILRDASGRLSVFIGRSPADATERDVLTAAITDALGCYARQGRPVVFEDEPGAAAVLSSEEPLSLEVGGIDCRLLDRRIVGVGWLATPNPEVSIPPRLVFASLKGGVGRSTALTVTAADLAARGKNVLVVDLDLEAPGLGELLLEEERRPRYGVVDFLVENGIGGVPEGGLSDFVGTSQLTRGGGGRVDVLPALGAVSAQFPENIMAKLARAMIEDVDASGTVPLERQIATMLDRMTAHEAYDVVLIDSRAGLAELAAPAMLGLGATVLLFGTAQQQTFEGYRALFAALHSLAQRDKRRGFSADWRAQLRPVHAKASLSPQVQARFLDEFHDLYSNYLYDAESDAPADPDALVFLRNDSSGPHWPLVIPFSPVFAEFDPLHVEDQLTAAFYEQTFRPFLNDVCSILGIPTTDAIP